MTKPIDKITDQEYQYGFTTDIETDQIPPGLNEDVIRQISQKKNEPDFMLQWRLKAYEGWLKMKEPVWAHVKYEPVDYQSLSYYSAPVQKEKLKSLDEVDPKLIETYNKLGIPLQEQNGLPVLR